MDRLSLYTWTDLTSVREFRASSEVATCQPPVLARAGFGAGMATCCPKKRRELKQRKDLTMQGAETGDGHVEVDQPRCTSARMLKTVLSVGDERHHLDLEPLLKPLLSTDNDLRLVYGRLADGGSDEDETAVEDLRRRRALLAERLGMQVLTAVQACELAVPGALAQRTDSTSQHDASSEPVTNEVISEWRERVEVEGFGKPSFSPSMTPEWPITLEQFIAEVGEPRDVETEACEEVLALMAVGRPGRFEQWAMFPPEVQRLWLSMLVARARIVEERCTGEFGLELKALFHRYRSWSQTERPGHINGLARNHSPVHDTWAEDATFCLARLRELSAGEVSLQPRTGAVLRAPRARPSTTRPSRVTPMVELPLLSGLCQNGRSLVVLGGRPQTEKLERLSQVVGFDIEWCGCEEADRLGRRIRGGHIAGVVVLEFSDHSRLSAVMGAARSHGVLVTHGKRGGLDSILAALRSIDLRLSQAAPDQEEAASTSS